MTENFLLSALGAGGGLAFGMASVKILLVLLDAPLQIRMQVLWSWRVLATGLALTFLSVFAFGLPSALQTVRPERRKIRFRQSLVATQVAVSCLLLIASGVLAHRGVAAASLAISFDYRNMIVVDPQLYTGSFQPAVAREKLDALSTRL